MTHTHVLAAVSQQTFDEIKGILLHAGYQHCMGMSGKREIINMTGIAITATPSTTHPPTCPICHRAHNVCPQCSYSWCLTHQRDINYCPQCGRAVSTWSNFPQGMDAGEKVQPDTIGWGQLQPPVIDKDSFLKP